MNTEPVFEGSSEITANDIRESTKLLYFNNASGIIVKVVMSMTFALGIVFLAGTLLLIFVGKTDNIAEYIKLSVICLGIFAVTSIIKNYVIKSKVNAPINQNLHANVRLYENSISYSTEYTILSARYSDASRLHLGKNVAVIEFNGTNPIIIPMRCFGWDNYKSACNFIRIKLKEQGG